MIEINRPQAWNGIGLTGHWLLTLKLDGVRAIWHDELGWLSRAQQAALQHSTVAAGQRP